MIDAIVISRAPTGSETTGGGESSHCLLELVISNDCGTRMGLLSLKQPPCRSEGFCLITHWSCLFCLGRYMGAYEKL
jgi:hypothetical protein